MCVRCLQRAAPRVALECCFASSELSSRCQLQLDCWSSSSWPLYIGDDADEGGTARVRPRKATHGAPGLCAYRGMLFAVGLSPCQHPSDSATLAAQATLAVAGSSFAAGAARSAWSMIPSCLAALVPALVAYAGTSLTDSLPMMRA